MLENKIYNNNNKARIKKNGGSQYASKDYSNPFFTERKNNNAKNNSFFNWKTKILSLILAIIITFLAWFFLYSDYFAINQIKAEGNGAIDKSDIEKIAWGEINYKSFIFSPKGNLIFYSKNNLINKIEEKYLFEKINIEHEKPNTLKIIYTEKKQSFTWIEADKYYNADRSGFIISETTPDEAQKTGLPVIENKSTATINNKKIAQEGKYIDFVFLLAEKYKEFPDYTPIKYIIDDSTNIIKTPLINGPLVFFSITEDVGKQLNKLTIIKNEKLKDDFKTKEYIDVSVGDSVYYK